MRSRPIRSSGRSARAMLDGGSILGLIIRAGKVDKVVMIMDRIKGTVKEETISESNYLPLAMEEVCNTNPPTPIQDNLLRCQ